MSYILDALRRADAERERERGSVPGLHARGAAADAEPAARDFRPLVWAAGGAGALLVAVLVALFVAPWRGQPAPPAALPPTAELRPAPADSALPSTAQGETPGRTPGALAPAALPVEPPIARTEAPRPAPEAAQARVAQAAPAAPARLAAQAQAGRVGVLAPKREVAPAPATDAAPAVEHYGAPLPNARPQAAAPANAVVGINDLPAESRATLPKLSVGGAIYSDVASARMLILNGQVYHEGEKPAADTVLEQIRHKSAVLNYRGLRYEITF